MIELSLLSIAKAVNGQLIGKDLVISEVFTDTRNKAENSLFVALIGENFDAHNFIDKAETQGALALLVSKSVESTLPQIIVEDTEKALGLLASLVRTKVAPKVIGITGSAGKTSVKEMVAQILKEVAGKEKVLSTAGNFNNHIGVPLTLLRLTGEEAFAVIEMGANHIGEIAYCASVAKPDVTVVNNVAPAHIEGFGSIEGVAKAKGEIYQALQANDIGVINLDSDFSDDYLKMNNFNPVTVSTNQGVDSDFSAENVSLDSHNCAMFDLTYKGDSVAIKLNVSGKHQVSNALVAAALAYSVGANFAQIKKGLEKSQSVQGRLNYFSGINGSSLIDDTYNASVASVKVAIDVLSNWQEKSILVLGDMAELGDESEKYHTEVGSYAKYKKINQLFTCGNWTRFSSDAFGDDADHFESKDKLIEKLINKVDSKTQVLVKGSRSARMEEVVAALKVDGATNQDEQTNTLGGGSQC